ncbi:SsrA-binding protein [subsurface metagenome]
MKTLAKNKKAYFDYEILEKFEAGIVLIGQEVKSIKAGRISLAGSFVVLRNGEVFLIGAKRKNKVGICNSQREEKS